MSLSGGALAANGFNWTGDEPLPFDGFLYIWWHGAHPLTGEKVDGKRGISMDNPEAELVIARDVRDGQFEMLFCSTDCLRRFFNALVDELERRQRKALLAAARRKAYRHGKAGIDL